MCRVDFHSSLRPPWKHQWTCLLSDLKSKQVDSKDWPLQQANSLTDREGREGLGTYPRMSTGLYEEMKEHRLLPLFFLTPVIQDVRHTDRQTEDSNCQGNWHRKILSSRPPWATGWVLATSAAQGEPLHSKYTEMGRVTGQRYSTEAWV